MRLPSLLLLGSILSGTSLANGFAIEPKSLIGRVRTSSNYRHESLNQKRLVVEKVSRSSNSHPVSSSSDRFTRLSGGAKAQAKSDAINGEGLAEKKPPTLLKEMIAEFIGTFIIVQIGCGTVCSAIFKSAQTGLWQIAAVWSIAVTLAISTTAAISGAHLNPAITVALALLRGFGWGKVLPFFVAQLGGAVAAAGVNMVLFQEAIASFEATNNIMRGTAASVQSASAFGEYWSVASWPAAFTAEAYGTAVLAFVIFALTNPKNETTARYPFLVPPLIGATVGALISVIAPLTQAGFNPARDFGPRIVAFLCGWKSIAMQGWWVYVVAPVIGAVLGGFVAEKVLYSSED